VENGRAVPESCLAGPVDFLGTSLWRIQGVEISDAGRAGRHRLFPSPPVENYCPPQSFPSPGPLDHAERHPGL
jgi:hypothetical protein